MQLALCLLLAQGKSIPPAMLLLSSQQPQAALKLGDAVPRLKLGRAATIFSSL